MSSSSSPGSVMAVLLHALHQTYATTAVVHVGAGNGVGDLHIWRQWPEVRHACCIDADPDRLATWADAPAPNWPAGWHALPAVVADTAGVRDYHIASNRDEDSLLPTGLLQTLWPRLQCVATEARPVQTLDALVGNIPPCGLIVDCLPALPVLRGAAQTLARSQWLCVRVAELNATDDDAQAAAPAAVTEHLTQAGFTPVAHVPGNHPALGYAFYARDWRPAMQHLQKAQVDLQAQLAAETQAKQAEAAAKADALKQRDTEAAAKAEALKQRDAETAAKSEALKQRDAEAQAKAALQKTTAELQQAQADLQAQLDAEIKTRQVEAAAKLYALKQCDVEIEARTELQAQLAAEAQAKQAEATAKAEALQQRDAEIKAKAETLAQRDAERRTRAALEQRLQQEEAAKAELQQRYDAELENQASQQNIIAQCRQRNAELETENAQLQLRQRLLQENLVRAEAQIDLIKDLLLREPGL